MSFGRLFTNFVTKNISVWKQPLNIKTNELSHLGLLTFNGEKQNDNHNKRCGIFLLTFVSVELLYGLP